MSITYCSLYAKKEKILLAESTTTESFHSRIKSLLNSILNDKEILNIIEIEGENIVTFLKSKKVVFICVSKSSHGHERPQRFIESFATMCVKEFGTVDQIIPEGGANHLCHQLKLNIKFNKHLDNYDTGVYSNKQLISEMNKDLQDIKHDLSQGIKKMVGNNDELEQMLVISKNITVKAEEYKEEAKVLEVQTRCFKPWMGITLIIMLVLLIVYFIFSLYLCGSLTVFCERKKLIRPDYYL